jgi:A/G-specific adenine glycosylase
MYNPSRQAWAFQSGTLARFAAHHPYNTELDFSSIRRCLARWYENNRRDLPWRRTSDPYAIWVSEIMLQQTRVAAVIPYYERFLSRFPDARALARASEHEVLTLWSGLGYYSRARNLQKAAKQVAATGAFPRDYEEIRNLPGIGVYTAAAVASIAFGLPYAVVDGNVRRVAVRIAGDDNADVQGIASGLLDRREPGRSNQALMELGAVVCTPRDPTCARCPIKSHCAAYSSGLQASLPAPRAKPETVRLERTLVLILKRGRILVAPSPRVRGFWDLPEPSPGIRKGSHLGTFRHTILHRQYTFAVCAGSIVRRASGMRWIALARLDELPLSTAAKKALRCLNGIG